MHVLYENINIFNGFNIVFIDLISIISTLSALLIVITKNPVVSVLYLILLFSNIAVYIIFMGAIFIGLSYLLVYVGAVSILFLFILMLINIRVSELVGETKNNTLLALIAVLAFFIPLSSILPSPEENYSLIDRQETQISSVSSNN